MKHLLSNWFLLILAFVTFLSYVQMVNMNFYQDDNALVFKFTHINEPAGNLGRGILGEGPYKYTITPYLPIFNLFGYNPQPYYILALGFILISVCVVYFFFLNLFKDRLKASLASLLFAAGYIGSDGLIRIFNSVLTSLSIIFSCGTIGFYYHYFQHRKLRWFFLSLLSFFLAVNLGFIRTHYLLLVVIAFEVIFFLVHKYKSLKQLLYSIFISFIRIIPFTFLFYKFIFLELDARSNQAGAFLQSLLKGESYNTYSFFATLGNMLLSNQIAPDIYSIIQQSFHFVITPKHLIILFVTILILILLYFYKSRQISLKASSITLILSAVVLLATRKIFSHQQLLTNINNTFSLFTGVFFIILSFILIKILPNKKLAAVLLIWIASNLILYSIYLPTSPLQSDDRYLTHSFVPLVGLLSLWSIDLYIKLKSNLRLLPILLIFLWGSINLFSAIKWHNEIIDQRSNPSKRFFTQLKNYYPIIPKQSIIYFYVPDKPDAHEHYDAGFGVGQMPDETAIAWRYNLDRYDLNIVNTFSDLKKQITDKNIPINHIFTFIADPDNLVDTTQRTRDLLEHGSLRTDEINLYSTTKLTATPARTFFIIEPIYVQLHNISSLTDLKVTLKLKGDPWQLDGFTFPLQKMGFNQPFSKETINSAFAYQKWQQDFFKNTTISTTSFWREKEPKLAIDQNPQSYWQSDRLKWSDEKSSIILDLKNPIELAGIIYKNGPSSLAPIKFIILTSENGTNFQKVTQVSRNYTDQESYSQTQKIIFSKIKAQYIKLEFIETSSDDSPAISEIEVIPEQFRNLNQAEVENFLTSPYNYIPSLDNLADLLTNFKDIGYVELQWKTDGSEKFRSTLNSKFAISYDGKFHDIDINLPGEGQNLKEIIIKPLTIPGNLTIKNIKYENITL